MPVASVSRMTGTDVVVVSHNSREELRSCLAPFAAMPDVQLIVVDNASSDGSLESVADLPIVGLRQPTNAGFAHGVNAGWRRGTSPYVLLLNPDAIVDPDSLARLAAVLDEEPKVGAVAPRIVDETGALDHSLRRFPRVRSTFAQALFLHRLAPRASWSDELIRDECDYEQPSSPDWVSGACVLLRRSALEQIDGLDDGFFMYAEDIDLCRRLRTADYDIRYEPEAVVTHRGGASAPRASLLPILAASKLRYARKHRGRSGAALERVGLALAAGLRVVVARDPAIRRGHRTSLRHLLLGRPPPQPPF
jgi:N-acetylglucosaminyl-diphospho-decaprenol L-rhamnosyltransferase